MRTFLAPLVAGALAITLFACGGDDPSPTPTTQPAATATTTSPAPSPTLQPTSTRTPAPDGGAVTILVPGVPDSPFDPGAGPAVLYDTATGETIDLGSGDLGRFSPDSSRYAWANNIIADADFGAIEVIDLATGETTRVGEGRGPIWLDDERVGFWLEGTNSRVAVHVETGASNPLSDAEYEAAFFRDSAPRARVPYDIRPDHRDPDSDCFAPALECDYVVLIEGDIALFDTHAFRVLPVDEETVLVANVPEDGVTDLFFVNLDTGQGRPIGSTTVDEFNFPLVAGPDIVAWVDDFCGLEQGNLFIHYRETGTTTEVDNGDSRWGYLESTPDGLLGIGDFGPFLLLNPASLEWTTALPGAEAAIQTGYGGDTTWSRDYRYAARGITGGHGGLCGS